MSEERREEEGQSFALPLVITGAEDSPVLFANHFMVSFQHEEIILTVGQLTPPLFLGGPEEQLAQAEKLSHVPVNVLARYGMPRDRARELLKILEQQLARQEEHLRQRGQST